ncbi:MAG: hypothetical protein IPP94_01705 [Ignavibacteria bacterium]|nr:hypothetical protein [Ignavibacteria bacterium]
MNGMFAMLGRVWTLVLLFPGMLYSQHRIEVRTVWDGRDEIGRTVPPGVYIPVLRAAYGAHSRMLLRGELGADWYDLQRSADAGRIWNAVTPKTWMRIQCILHDRAKPFIYAFCSLTPQRGAVGWRTQVGCVDEAKNLIV